MPKIPYFFILQFCYLAVVGQELKLMLPIGHTDYVRSAEFSPDGKKIVTASLDNTAKIWDAVSGTLLADLKGHSSNVLSAIFSPDGKRVVTASEDHTAKIWDATSGKLLADLKGHTDGLKLAKFSSDGKRIVTASKDKTAKIWDAASGTLLADLKGHTSGVNSAVFSPDGKKIVTASLDKTAKLWDAVSATLLADLKGHTSGLNTAVFSPDGKKIVTASEDSTAKIWDAASGKLLADLQGHRGQVYSAVFSPDGKKIVTASSNIIDEIWYPSGRVMPISISHQLNYNTAKIWDAVSGTLLADLKGHTHSVSSAAFSPDGKKVVTASWDGTAKIWDASSGELLADLKGHASGLNRAEFSPDGKKIITASEDNTAKIWDAASGILLVDLKGHTDRIYSFGFSPDGRRIVTTSQDNIVKIWDATSGALLANLKGHTQSVSSAAFSPDGKKVVTASWDKTAKIWDASSGELLADLKGHINVLHSAVFSPDGKKIVTASQDYTAKIWDAASGILLADLKGNTGPIYSAVFSPDGKKIVTSKKTWDAASGELLKDFKGYVLPPDGGEIVTTCVERDLFLVSNRIFRISTKELLFTFFPVDSTDYLVTDAKGRYDGTEAARKLLYFTCGTEVISLDQVKDQLWVPNLAERVMKGDSINTPKLSDLNICGLTPLVETMEGDSNQYRFKITPRGGGLGETVLSVNRIEVKRYKPDELAKVPGGFELVVKKQALSSNFIDGKENPVTVNAYTSHNNISSRRVTNIYKTAKNQGVHPNLYVVMVGINNYKGTDMDLKYPEKDAIDLSKVIGLSGRKLFNGDGKEHVFIYDINTSNKRMLFPEKQTIKHVLEDSIGKRATKNDILIIFLAGHGTTLNNQFLFLTAESSSSSIIGITSDELFEWTKPENIKAQKRMLVLDACQSGQILNDLAGENKSGWLGRSTENSDQIKDIDKLNERSGMFILSAAARDQDARESEKYSHGLLTYALLKAIKEKPEILEEGNLLNVGNWFLKAESMVNELVAKDLQPGETLRQDPKILSSGNFDIGIVDNDLLGKIGLKNKAMISEINFQNEDVNISADTIGLNHAISQSLSNIIYHDIDNPIIYNPLGNSDDSYSISGRYSLKGNIVIVKVKIFQHHNVEKFHFEVNGDKSDLNNVVTKIVKETIEKLSIEK